MPATASCCSGTGQHECWDPTVTSMWHRASYSSGVNCFLRNSLFSGSCALFFVASRHPPPGIPFGPCCPVVASRQGTSPRQAEGTAAGLRSSSSSSQGFVLLFEAWLLDGLADGYAPPFPVTSSSCKFCCKLSLQLLGEVFFRCIRWSCQPVFVAWFQTHCHSRPV